MKGAFKLGPLVAAASFLAAVGLRLVYLAEPLRLDRLAFPMFLGDEGVHGLMGLHIQAGARPVFYYGSYYLGALDAYVAAALFSVFGSSIGVLRAVPGIFALVCVFAAWAVARHMYGPQAGWLAAAMVALPSPFVFEWGTIAICGYAAYVLVVLLFLRFFLALAEKVTTARLVGMGFLGGFALWNNGLLIPYVLVVAAALWLWVPLSRRDAGVLLAAFALGIAPLVYGNVVMPLTTVRQLARKVLFAWNLGRQHVARDDEEDNLQYRAHPILEVVGAQTSREGRWSPAGTAAGLVLVAGAAGALAACRRARGWRSPEFRDNAVLLSLVGVSLVLGAGGWAGQPVGRYQLPLYALLAIAAAGWLVRLAPRAAPAIVTFVVLTHAVEIARPVEGQAGTTPPAVLEALGGEGLRYGYSAGPMYDAVFRSRESVILVPLDHSRYPAYEPRVEQADAVFYVYRTDQEKKPAHRAFLRLLAEGQVEHRTMEFGDFHVLYGFEPRSRVSAAAIARVRDEFRREKFGG